MSILCIDGERVAVGRPLKVGDVVKVSLPVRVEGQIETEAPWADVVEVIDDGSMWLGRIANYLVYSHGFDYGDEVLFHDEDGRCGARPRRRDQLSG